MPKPARRSSRVEGADDAAAQSERSDTTLQAFGLSLTPLTDLGRSARQAPLHRLRAAGIGAAGDDAEVGARPIQHRLADVGLDGRVLDGARRLGAMGELLPQEMLGALLALGRLCRRRACLAGLLARLLARLLGEFFARVHDGGAADLGDLGDLGRRCVRLGPQRGEGSITRLGGGMTFVFPPPPRVALPLRPRPPGALPADLPLGEGVQTIGDYDFH